MISQRLAQRVTEVIKGEYGFTVPWEMIIELIMMFISQCQQNRSTFSQTAKNPSKMQRAAANVIIRRTTEFHRRSEVVAIQQSMFRVGAEAPDEELFACHDEVVAVMNYQIGPEPEYHLDTTAPTPA